MKNKQADFIGKFIVIKIYVYIRILNSLPLELCHVVVGLLYIYIWLNLLSFSNQIMLYPRRFSDLQILIIFWNIIYHLTFLINANGKQISHSIHIIYNLKIYPELPLCFTSILFL